MDVKHEEALHRRRQDDNKEELLVSAVQQLTPSIQNHIRGLIYAIAAELPQEEIDPIISDNETDNCQEESA